MTDEFPQDESLEPDTPPVDEASVNEAKDAAQDEAGEDRDTAAVESAQEEHEAAELQLKGLIIDICLGVMALVSCIVAFATSGKMEDRSATQPVPLTFVDESVTAEMTVRIDQRNRLLVNKQPLGEYTTLRDYLSENGLSPKTVHVVASQDCLMESVLHAIRSLKRLGVTQVFLSTSSI